METGADFEKAAEPAAQFRPAGARFDDPAEHLQQC